MAKQEILDLLDQTSGNVQAVAKRLGVSNSYVSRIKRKEWKPSDPELGRALAPAENREVAPASEQIMSVLAPNIPLVQQLRDDTLRQLNDQVQSGTLDERATVRLIEVLLRYENALRTSVQPKVNVFNDNRGSLQVLVKHLEEMSPDSLRALAGVDEGNVLEAEYSDASNE